MAARTKSTADRALAAVPVILAQLDADGCAMLAELLQATRDGGYADGFADAACAACNRTAADCRCDPSRP